MNDIKPGPDDDPYGDRPPTYHMAKLIDPRGRVSPLCAKVPRAIRLDRGESWTLRKEAVTCAKCLARLKETASG